MGIFSERESRLDFTKKITGGFEYYESRAGLKLQSISQQSTDFSCD